MNIIKLRTVESGRADKIISSLAEGVSRSYATKLIKDGRLKLSDGTVISDPSAKIADGVILELSIPEPEQMSIEANNTIEFDIAYEDNHLIVINKPAGLTVHPAPGHANDTLVNALLAHAGDSLSGIGGVARPGIVHRLDKDTSGLMLVAKNDAAHASLSEQLSTRTLKRTYSAICYGVPRPTHGIISTLIGRHPKNRQKMAVLEKGGKEAVTHYRTIKSMAHGLLSEVECELETGRTHQIRVHLSHIGNAIVGDQVYGNKNRKSLDKLDSDTIDEIWAFPRQALHAKKIRFIHPATKNPLEFEITLPPDIRDLLALVG